MDCGFGGKPGGIESLLTLIHQHREAIQYDLLVAGLRLSWVGTPRLAWDDFAVWVKFVKPESQLYQSAYGPQWSREMHRLTDIADILAAANYQRGGSRGPRPKPFKRPGDKNSQTFGRAVPIDDVRQFLTERNGRAPGG